MQTFFNITADELERWCSFSLTAPSDLPTLVRRLLLETTNPIKLDIRSGVGTRLRGFDCHLEVRKVVPCLPDGEAVIEMGTNQDVKTKAEEDYKKRTGQTTAFAKKDVAFIFVTPRRWSGKQDWINEKKKDGVWKEVSVIDADDFEAWLIEAPATNLWLSKVIGKRNTGLALLCDQLEEFFGSTNPPLTASLMLGERNREREELVKLLTSDNGYIYISGKDKREAKMFAASVMQSESNAVELEALFSKSVCIASADDWRSFVSLYSDCLLIPEFDDPLAIANPGQNRVLIPLDATDVDKVDRNKAVFLPKMKTSILREELKKLGVEDNRAERMASDAHGSISVLSRMISKVPKLTDPTWASESLLVPLVLIGNWDGSNVDDAQCVEEATGKKYDDVQRFLSEIINQPDSPLEKVGSVWRWLSREQAWHSLKKYFTKTTIQKVLELCQTSLGEIDPRFTLPEEERWMANVKGAKRMHSDVLRKSLANTLPMLACISNHANQQIDDYQNIVDVSVQKIFSHDNSFKLWSSIGNLLPLLAEAAPSVFLEIIEKAVKDHPNEFIQLMKDEHGAFGFGSCLHSGLLWALETLAWSDRYLARASLLLARLHKLDPGGRWANRPLESLREIYTGWFPQTAASLNDRLASLDYLILKEPKVANELLAALVPTGMDTVGRTSYPTWRDWRSTWQEGADKQEAQNFFMEVKKRLTENSIDPKVVANLIERLLSFGLDDREKIYLQIEQQSPEEWSSDERRNVMSKIRHFVHWRRAYAHKDSPIAEGELSRLESIHNAIGASNPILSHDWLFSSRPDNFDVVPGLGWDAQQKAADVHRDAAAKEVHDEFLTTENTATILGLIHVVDNVTQFGYWFAKHDKDNAAIRKLLSTISGDVEQERYFFHGYARYKAQDDRARWFDFVRSLKSQSGEIIKAFLVASPFDKQTWDFVKSLGAETDRDYWAAVYPQYGSTAENEGQMAVERFVEAKRGLPAAHIVNRTIPEKGLGEWSVETLLKILECSAIEIGKSGKQIDTMDAYYLEDIIARLQDSKTDRDKLIRMEFTYLPMLTHGEVKPKLLYEEMLKTEFFLDVLKRVYKRKDDIDDVPKENRRSAAKLCFELLHNWNGYPEKSVLSEWTSEVRKLCGECSRQEIGDEEIGRVLARVPADEDGVWPPKQVTDIIESTESDHIEIGFSTEIYNSRGTTSRGLEDGGVSEREIEKKYRELSERFKHQPRVAKLMDYIADHYKNDAKYHDQDSDLLNEN